MPAVTIAFIPVKALSAFVLFVIAAVRSVAALDAAVMAGFCFVETRVSRFFFAVSAVVFFVG